VIRRLFIAPTAKKDLAKIWHYIALDSPSAADRMLDEFHDTMRRLAEAPGIGHHRREFTDRRLRFHSVRSYLIAYTFTSRQLRVIRVVSGYRNISKLFRRR
jgi:toxin ParE1/3/4